MAADAQAAGAARTPSPDIVDAADSSFDPPRCVHCGEAIRGVALPTGGHGSFLHPGCMGGWLEAEARRRAEQDSLWYEAAASRAAEAARDWSPRPGYPIASEMERRVYFEQEENRYLMLALQARRRVQPPP